VPAYPIPPFRRSLTANHEEGRMYIGGGLLTLIVIILLLIWLL
jgi:flagellar biogenesis protein FliO